MKSTQEASSSKHHVQKFRSPPPKPPRRRNSDHSTSALATLCDWKKGLDDQPTSTPKDSLKQLYLSKSSSETFPPNWFAEFHHNDNAEHDSNDSLNLKLVDTDTDSSLDKICLFNKDSYSGNHLLGQYYPYQSENMNLTVQSTSCARQQSSDHEMLDHSKLWSSTKYSNSTSQFSTPCSMSNTFGLQFKEENSNLFYSFNDIPSDLKKDIFQSSSAVKVIHRRHHSDPLLSRFHKPLKKVCHKTSSHRSHSFVDTSSSCNPTITERSLKNKYCLPLSKDPEFLMEEIKVLKEMNNQLWRHLCSAQAKLDRLQNSNVLVKSDVSDSPSFAELISSIYYAQKEKDNAIESCLQTTLKERDSAFLELEEIMQVLSRNSGDADSSDSDKEMSNQEIKDLLKEIEITQNPQKILKYQRMLLSYLYQAREEKHQHLSHNFQMALVEKNTALSMIKHLKNELDLWKHSSDSWHIETKQWESTLLDTLCHVISQRDSALSKVNSLQSELNSLEHNWKIQKSVASSIPANSDYESLQKQDFSMQCHGGCKVHCMPNIDNGHEPLSDNKKNSNFQITPVPHCEKDDSLKSEVQFLTRNLKIEARNRQIAEENCLRLERLVNVLRKKVNGLSVGVHV